MTIQLEEIRKPNNIHGLRGAALFNETRKDKEILKTMDEDTYEELIASWAYYYCKNSYEDVLRLGGAGDGGMDVVAYYNQAADDCDIYQCKHYKDAINKSAVIAELGKFLYHIYTDLLPCPRSYYLMAPNGLSAKFTHIYTNSVKLKDMIVKEWDTSIAKHIEKNECFKCEGDLKSFLESFDYKIFKFYSPDRLLHDICDKKNRHVYFQYFGVKKEELVKTKLDAPKSITEYESKYIHHLIDAYNDVNSDGVSSDNVEESAYGNHYKRSREQFWLAESVRKMSQENCPGDSDEFAELENDMYHHVADIYEEEHDNAFKKVKAVTDKATSFQKKDRIISGELGSPELKGVCFQLSNEDKLIWKK